MRNFILCSCLFRIVLPLLLTTCIVFRPSFISAIYLIFLLYAPFVPVPTARSMKGHTGRYFTLLTAVTVLAFLCQLSFQIVLLAIPPYAHFLKNCEFLEKILRHAGFVHMEALNAVSVTTWLAPEIIAVLSAIVLFVVCAKLTSGGSGADGAADPVLEDGTGTPRATVKSPKSKTSGKGFKLFVAMGRYVVLALLCCAAIVRPSVQGGVYFLCFLASATWWSCYRELRRGFAYLLRVLMLLVFAHVGCLYAYQFQWPQEMLEGNGTYARYFGLTPLMTVDCDEPRDFVWADVEWASYFNPLLLIWLYYSLAIESKQLLKPQVSLHKSRQNVMGETTPLMRGVSSSQRYGSGERPKTGPNVFQDSTGSVIVSTDNPDDIQLEEIGMDTVEDEEKSSLFENIISGLESILQFIIQTSYIATNIIMMAWSITYHSWITFLLLLWASILWMVPNQRKSMLRCSPFLVFYAWFLLISAYIYSMDLTDEELPSIIYGIDMSQVGFIKNMILPCKQLGAKCLYTVMFWITLRQYMKERQMARQSNTLADMVAPLQVSVGAATGMTNERTDSGVRVMERVGQVVKASLTKFWIWIVASTLFAVAITGDRMTGFRILYMALFLFFILSFQLSFRFWRKVMFAFWLTVIIYSMIILVMVYTYQFNNFDTYWVDYLHVDKEQQQDIGLEKYETKQLFVRLVTPTFFVIIAVIQLHYFHRDFMTMTDPRRRPTVTDGTSIGAATATVSVIEGGATRSEANSSAQGGLAGVGSSSGSSGVARGAPVVDSDDEEGDEGKGNSCKLDLTDIGNVSSAQLQARFAVHLAQLQRYLNLILLFLELHMPKWVLGAAMIVCVYDRCAIYLLIVGMVVVGACCSRRAQMAAIYGSSVLVSALLLARMLYQIKYVEHGTWNVTCEFENTTSDLHNMTVNNAEWLGFTKTVNGRDLPKLVRWNIAYILVVTLLTIVLVRQANYRASRGRSPSQRPFFMFPKVKRSDADKDLVHCVKYLLNYGYYKFGVEASLMATCALIGFRMDMYALFYAIWLCIIFPMTRHNLSRVWNIYLFFIAFFIPIQYIMSIGLPPGLCIEYPWDDSEMLRRVQEWAYLIDSQYPPSPKKLLCDFVLLLFVARQSVVFRIENRYANRPYPGGINDSIIHNAEQKGFVLPVPDFITYVWSYLDIVKRGILLSFMWVTLAIVFLAGTNRVSLFSIGYLIGSFFFLWQGSDIYLRPIPKILKSWNVLLGYNVSVILIKTFLQLVGCIFIADVQENACWLVQLLGIGCVRKFKNPVTLAGITDPNECSVPREYIGLAWDGLCFGFLLMQRRIFNSYNFFHMVDDTKASAILASRGAELIDELKLKRMREQDEQERRILEKIKAKMDRIKANQQKIQGPSKEPSTHYVDSIFPSSNRPRFRKKRPNFYKEAVRSGDYYMFDELDDDDDLDVEDMKPTDEEGQDRLRRRSSKKRTIGEIEEHVAEKVVIKEDKKEKEDDFRRQPQPGTSKDEDISDFSESKRESKCQTILNYILFLWAFIDSAMISATNYLNRYTKDYRYVLRVLTKEKKLLKETTEYNVGLRIGSNQVWQPSGSYHSLLANSRQKQRVDIAEEYDTSELSSYDQPSVVRLMLAAWYIVLSHSDILCYLFIFLNQIKSATFLSLPLPLMVFFWGTLTIPRPSKTFWVTIIAYTQVIVLIKCVFQFEFFPWNAVPILNPFDAPRIIGIEQKNNYAVWDLLLLLIIFFHRFMLKCMGLWKTEFAVPTVVLPEGEYKVENGQIIPVIHRENEKSILSPPSIRTAPSVVRTSPLHHQESDLQRLVEESEDGADDEPSTNSLVDTSGAGLGAAGHSTSADSSGRSISPRQSPADGAVTVASGSGAGGGGGGDGQLVSDGRAEDSGGDVVRVENNEMTAMDLFPGAIQLSTSKYAETAKEFFQQLADPTSRVAADVYSYMFMCDFYNFFVILLGYSAFGAQQGDGGVSSYLEDNRVPVLFLLMLILQFLLIIIDRAIFLRKNIVGKIIFQFIQIFILHVWLFILFPAMTERSFNSVLPPQMYYMMKCFYLLLSAYQIRCGYPSRILGNFLCKGYGYLNMFLFKGFMFIPFLFELRTVMDWMWTDTSMTVMDWIKMEDIFAHIFQLKCSRHVESEYPQPRGEKKKPNIKYLMGGGLLALIIAIIWFPLVFFSLGNAVGEPNPPYDITLDLRIGPYEPIYRMSAQTNSIFQFKENDYNALLNKYTSSKNKVATTFISNYEPGDIVAVKLSGDSASIWSISPPDMERMLDEVNSTSPISVRLQYQVSHHSNTKEDPGVMREEQIVTLDALVDGKPNPARQNLLLMLTANATNVPPIPLSYIIPKFIKVTNRATAKPIVQLMEPNPVPLAQSMRNITIKLQSTPDRKDRVWWELQEDCGDYNYLRYLKNIPYADCNFLMLYAFNDKIFPSTLNIITGGGIIGLYTTLVFVASRVLRGFFTEICFKIMFDDMPNVDRVLQLCLDIYLVREAAEFCLEEDLFAKLVFLFRSPETLIKWTREKEEDDGEGEEDEEEED